MTFETVEARTETAVPEPPTAADPSAVDGCPTNQGTVSWGPLLVVMAGTFMTILDFFIVNVAVPNLQSDLSATRPAVQLVVAGYGLTFAIGLITGGRLGDLYGRRRMFALGLMSFTAASAACALAPSVEVLIGARMAQGAAAAMLTPQVLAILGTLYVGEHRARAFAVYGMVLGLAGVFGQLVGGALIQLNPAGLEWRSIFLINVPVGLVALSVTRRMVPESERDLGVKLDLTGTALVSAGLLALMLPLVEGRERGWPTWTWASMAGALLLLGSFAMHQRSRAASNGNPLVDPHLFRDRGFTAGLAITLIFLMASGSFFFVLALYLQQGRGLSALESGGLFIAVGAGFFAGMLPAAALAARLGRQVLALGASIAATGYLAVGATADGIGNSASVAWLAPGLALAGLGIGLVLAPLAATVLERVRPQHAGAASGVLSTAQELGGALGVTVVGAAFYNALGSNTGGHAFAHALATSAVIQAGLAIVAAGLVQLLPRASGDGH